MQRLFSSGMVHHGGYRVAECAHVASEIGRVMGLLVYMTKKGGLSACFLEVVVSLWCSGIFSKEVKINLAAVSARLLPRMFVGSLILFSLCGDLGLLYREVW